jgi:hypothetical protein
VMYGDSAPKKYASVSVCAKLQGLQPYDGRSLNGLRESNL